MGWYCYLEERLRFPFRAKCIAHRAISPLRKGQEVEVVALAPADECDLGPVEAPPFVLRAGLTPTGTPGGRDVLRKGTTFLPGCGYPSTSGATTPPNKKRHRANRFRFFGLKDRRATANMFCCCNLLAACLQEQLAPSIAWLEHSPDGAAFRNEWPADAGWVFCAELPMRVEGAVRDHWMSAMQTTGAAGLVTSGSSEFRHGFEIGFADRAPVTKFVLPPFSVAEAAHFAGWFQTRAEIAREAAALWRDGMSLTEFLFALQHGKPPAELISDGWCALHAKVQL